MVICIHQLNDNVYGRCWAGLAGDLPFGIFLYCWIAPWRHMHDGLGLAGTGSAAHVEFGSGSGVLINGMRVIFPGACIAAFLKT